MITDGAGVFTIRLRYRLLARGAACRAIYDIGFSLLFEIAGHKVQFPARRFDEGRCSYGSTMAVEAGAPCIKDDHCSDVHVQGRRASRTAGRTAIGNAGR